MDQTGKGKCVHFSLTISLFPKEPLFRLVRFRVVQCLFDPDFFGLNDEVYDDLVILVDCEETESDCWSFATNPTACVTFFLFLPYLNGQ
jgi:hypothetical protein